MNQERTARLAGALYAASGIPAVFSLLYVPGKLIVSGDAAETARRVLASETLFRAGMVCELVNAVMFVFVVGALYRLFRGVDERQASLMLTLFLPSVPISFLNVLNEIAALALFRGADYLSVVGEPQREALGMLFIRLHGQGINLAAIFWGLWLVPFGVLVIRSGFFPKVLGWLLLLNSLAYPATSLTSWLAPGYLGVVSRIAVFAELGELWIMLWLLIKGANVPPSAAAAAEVRT